MLLRRYIVGVKIFGVLLLLTGCLFAQIDRATLDEGFDKPLKRIAVDYGPSQYYQPAQHVRNRLTCYYYSNFVVKQYDEGQKGAELEWLSVDASPEAACTRKHRKDERVYRPEEWSGYFRGAKGSFVFFDAPDGDDGGMAFAAFDVQTGRKLYEDVALLRGFKKSLHIKSVFSITGGGDQPPRVNYFHVTRASCNMKKEPTDCWKKVRVKFGISQTQVPACTGYEHSDGGEETVVVYPVSVVMTNSPQTKTVNGPVFCWSPD